VNKYVITETRVDQALVESEGEPDLSTLENANWRMVSREVLVYQASDDDYAMHVVKGE